MILFRDLTALVQFATLRAQRGLYDGRMTRANQGLISLCRHGLRLAPDLSAVVIYTRDVGHHSGGWWKNPEYERCFHLSLSFCAGDPRRGAAGVPFDRPTAEVIARQFFGDDARWAWIEGPYSPEGRAHDVWHYRLFCDPAWAPILPRGEVYSRDWTPADWRSFSDIHGWTPEVDQAPFLLADGEA